MDKNHNRQRGMFKNPNAMYSHNNENQGKDMLIGFKKAFQTNPCPISKHKLLTSPHTAFSKPNQRQPSPFINRFKNKQNQQPTQNYMKNSSGLSPMKIPLTPSKLKNVCQSPRGLLKNNYEGSVQFRTKSPTPAQKLFDFKKVLPNQYETTREEQQGCKLLNLNTKRTSLEYTSHEDNRPQNKLLDDIIAKCNLKQQQSQMKNSTGMQFRPKSPLLKLNQNARTKGFSNYVPKNQSYTQCCNNDGKQAKYRLLSNQNNSSQAYYCSKCAILLIQQGYNVEELELTHTLKTHSAQVLQIIQGLASVSNQLERKYEATKSLRNKHCQSYTFDLNNIDQYYNSLIKSIEELRSKDKQIIRQYQAHSLRDIDNFMSRLQQTLTQIETVKQQIQNKPDMIEFMRNNFQQHIQIYQELLHYQEIIPEKNISIVNDYGKIEEFKSVLLNHFSLIIQTNESEQKEEMQSSNGVAFSFEGAMLEEEQKNRQKPFRDLFSGGEEEQQKYQVDEVQQQLVARSNEHNQNRKERCSPSFKKI